MNITAFDLAQRFIGLKEAPGSGSNPQVLSFLQLDNSWPAGDDVAWCSAFVNYIAWLLRLPRSKGLAARSWLNVGIPITDYNAAKPEFDVVILMRGEGPQPGPDVVNAQGHVGLFAAYNSLKAQVSILGGNQGDQVSIATYPTSKILGIRRLSA